MVLPFGSFLVTRFPTLSYVPAKLVEPLLVNSPLKSYSVCRILSKHRSGIEEELEVLFGDKAEASPELDWNQQKTRSDLMNVHQYGLMEKSEAKHRARDAVAKSIKGSFGVGPLSGSTANA